MKQQSDEPRNIEAQYSTNKMSDKNQFNQTTF